MLEWIHKLKVDRAQEQEIDVNDDLARELVFYTQALDEETIKKWRKQRQQSGFAKENNDELDLLLDKEKIFEKSKNVWHLVRNLKGSNREEAMRRVRRKGHLERLKSLSMGVGKA
ncbi:rRNA-processing protein EBP2 [Canna indica]|uniref:rRNA-processing protein EBP2 n=1 Tax=Canna indica TaxID=4628 RepID=A0AAQ3KCM7_9LILI|nr:rRNA-processing protein EBP2 [Canna indica]